VTGLGDKEYKLESSSTLLGIVLHLACCGIPLLLIVLATTGIGSFFAGLAEQWWLVASLLITVVVSSILIAIGLRKRRN
jgi:membrane protein YdbS with pleckstrin-like domain